MKRIFSPLWFFVSVTSGAQEADSNGKTMLTIILPHDQSKTVDEIDDHLEKTGFPKKFSTIQVSISFPTTSSWGSDISSHSVATR